ncbi:NAD(P)/FAD-dependent oxidoreductase [Thalassococcus sp. BH17M4-6]|uniref:NAD(P)/FAD-dependent oxidoreductase n=1 Tax=Thalassococcus sp. BH17M4-6 TaxID=3413148 RepID=UPI003BDE0A3B
MTVCVLGAGLLGTLSALELAERGRDVVLIDAGDQPVTGTSLHNEGKIHLGYVYARDRTQATARLMARGATRFSALLDRWWPAAEIMQSASSPFDYLVMADSLEHPDRLERVYAEIDDTIGQHLSAATNSYLGRPDLPPVQRLTKPELEETYDPQYVVAAFRTPERAIDLSRMAHALRTAIRGAGHVTGLWSTRVQAVRTRSDGRFDILTGDGGLEGPFTEVVNALWHDRLRVDATLGIEVTRPFLFRQKVAHRMQVPGGQTHGASATMVLGPYGDFVTLPSGSCYLSWYPTSCIRRTDRIRPPDDWNDTPDSFLVGTFDSAVEELARRVPGIARLAAQSTERSSVPGVIFCWGQTDVDDPQSELHARHDVGLSTLGPPGYHTVDTGKLTLAPLFAEEIADRIAPR